MNNRLVRVIWLLFLIGFTTPASGLDQKSLAVAEVTERDEWVLVGERDTLTYGSMAKTIPAMIERVFAKVYSVRPPVGRGSLVMIYQTPDGDDAVEDSVMLSVGLEIARGADRDALPQGLSAFDYPKMRTISATYTGDVAGLEAAWASLVIQAKAAGETPADHRREVYRKWVATDSKKNVIELVLGLVEQDEQVGPADGKAR